MRALLLLFLLGALAAAEDAVHLRNGGILHGRVVRETTQAVDLDLGTGRITIPRTIVRLVERGVRSRPRQTVTQRDEWFLVLHKDKVVGWRHLVQIQQPARVQVEEHTVFFRPGGGDDVAIRRVEAADPRGRPLDFLLVESYGNETELTWGEVKQDGVLVHILRGGKSEFRALDLTDGWELALPAWSRFLTEAKANEVRTISVLDPRRLEPATLVLRRDEDAAAPEEDDRRPCRALQLTGDSRRSRALYRVDEGSLAVELNGPSLIARRSTRARVEMARRAHREPQPLQLDEAFKFPFYRRPKDLTAYHPRGGLSLKAPDAGWLPTSADTDSGRLLSFEKLGLFASLEVFAYPAGSTVNVDGCLERAMARLELSARSVRRLGSPDRRNIAGLPARTLRLAVRHRQEDLRCRLTVVRAKNRYLVLVGAAPERNFRWADRDFHEFLESLVVVP